ncbi:unnamed protein product [Linum trigynum]|uniref:Uncharacterized protein n=1 Tax=Linum trigynum TaxID=586398 RepID=A0AAV2GGR9_9ROSI
MGDYISNDDGKWGGAEPSCLFGFDLNVPLTSNDENIYEIGAKQSDPTENGDDGDVLGLEELVNEDHPEWDKITNNIQYGVDVENNDHFVLQSGYHAHSDDSVAENGIDDNNGGLVSTIVTSDSSTWNHLRFQNQDEFTCFLQELYSWKMILVENYYQT